MSDYYEHVTASASYRAATEDRVEVLRAAGGLVIVVADGVGGRPGGGAAADAVIRLVREAAPAAPDPADAGYWCDVLARADRAIAADPAAGETTVVVAGASARGLGGASVGDSEAWIVGDDDVITVLSRAQKRKPYLGLGTALPVPFHAGSLDGLLLVATDGLFKYASPEQIRTALGTGPFDAAAGRLVDVARSPCSGTFYDDVAVAVCRRAGAHDNPSHRSGSS